MNDIHTVSDNLNFILYADDTTLSSPMCSSTRGCNGNIEQISTSINSELNKIADWLAVNKLSLNVQKTKFMIFHYRQRVITENDIPCLVINNTLIERVTEFNFLGLTVNEYMNWNSHIQNIANKILRILGVMNRLNDICLFQQWNLCMIRWSFHTSNLELQIGALNGIAYQSYRNAPSVLWQIAVTMLTPSRSSNNYICWM